MRKIVLLFTLLALCGFATKSVAEVTTSITIANDWVNPEQGETYTKQKFEANWQSGWLGYGLLVVTAPESDYVYVQPSLTMGKGPLSAIVGITTDSAGSSYYYGGASYAMNFGKVSAFLDARNYWGMEGTSPSYLDNYLGFSLVKIGKAKVGLDLVYDYWWELGDDFYMVGPTFKYALTKSVTLYARPSMEWFVSDGNSTSTEKLRIGLNFSF